MIILVFDRSYSDFLGWRSKNFPKLPVNGSLEFVGKSLERFISIERNSFYIANCPLTSKEEDLVILRDLIEIKLVR